MARILVQRGTSSNASRSTGSSSSSGTESQVSSNVQVPPATIDGETTDEKQEEVNVVEQAECSDAKDEPVDREDDEGLIVSENVVVVGSEDVDCDSPVSGGDDPDSPPIPFPPPKPSSNVTPDNRRSVLGSFGALRMGSTQRGAGPTGSHPSSPRSHSEDEGYNSSDEHMPCFVLSHAGSGLEREHEFETEIRQPSKSGVCWKMEIVSLGLCCRSSIWRLRVIRHDQTNVHDYMEHERDHFSQFITEGFTSYLKRKRRNKVYGNNMEIQALAEMYNRPIHIYSYSTEPINIFQGSYNTETPPIRLSYHHGNQYNSLVDPHRLTVAAGLGFGSLSGRHVAREQVKAAIKAQQEHQIDNALVADGRYYSDLELTEKEIERSVMEGSRAEYLMEWSKPRTGPSSNAETSSSGASEYYILFESSHLEKKMHIETDKNEILKSRNFRQ